MHGAAVGPHIVVSRDRRQRDKGNRRRRAGKHQCKIKYQGENQLTRQWTTLYTRRKGL